MGMSRRFGKIAYGSFFTILLPFLLTIWALRLDHSGMAFWAIQFKPWVGMLLSCIGLALMALSMKALWQIGKGLPMNAYPPIRLVKDSSYAVLAHPIYVGFVLTVGGISIAANSLAGLWVVTPIMALATVALVAGYEGPRLRERFGDAVSLSPLFGIPPANSVRASLGRRLAAGTTALAPWAIAYSVFSIMPEPQGTHDLRMDWENAIPTAGWMIWVYSAAYPAVIASPLLLRTNAELRRFVVGAWLATVLGLSLMLIMPGRAVFLPLSHDSQIDWLLNTNRALDAEWLAFPSFHALWIIFAAYCFSTRYSRMGPLWILLAAWVCVSCVLTGSHAIVDVISGIGFGMLCWHHENVWLWLVERAEVLSNSWNAVQIGPVRIISHAIWSAAAAATGILMVEILVGPRLNREITTVFFAGLLTAGAWGYWLEGGNRLSRPFGYYGFLFGSIAALLILGVADPGLAQLLAAALAIAAPLAQAIGRMRCLVQGCCHGKPVVAAFGLRVTHPNSRVTALSQLRGIAIHPTQLYSIAGNLLIFALLWRLWNVGANSNFIGGLYLIFSSLIRFVEEHFRGEAQTPRKYGLAIYQWLAIMLFVAGILVSMTAGLPGSPAPSEVSIGSILLPIIAGLTAALFMSVDFPQSSWRFSRLTVDSTTSSTT